MPTQNHFILSITIVSVTEVGVATAEVVLIRRGVSRGSGRIIEIESSRLLTRSPCLCSFLSFVLPRKYS